ncbi:PIN domain-containing protein [Saccharopolyspora sp. 5N708]|uniref:PIN domain-containing protein n=1 Tax=Saccharopolyspora sp. 5N708 TaxID=3457424 RepID=UPI003FD21B44
MALVVVYDANVLYPSFLRDLLVRIAQAGLVDAKWTHRILDEAFGRLQQNRPDLNPISLRRTRELMIEAVRDCLVSDYERLLDAVSLPDQGDRHVLAAAIKARAQLIITKNLKDFPVENLGIWGVEARHPDEFLMGLLQHARPCVHGEIQRIADSLRKPPGTFRDVLAFLERDGLFETAAALRR